MRLSKIALVGVLCLSALMAADDDRRRDGNWWRSGLTPAERQTYIVGFYDGMELGEKFSFWGMSKEDSSGVPAGKAIQSYDKMMDAYLANVTNEQLAEGITKFYEDFRNRKILIYAAAWIVANQISGKSDDEIKKLTENFRKNAH